MSFTIHYSTMNNVHSYSHEGTVVVGAGVAGLTAALGLARAGRHVTVLERADALPVGGYKIDVRGAAVEVPRRIGLESTVRGRHLRIRAGSVVTADGTTVTQMGGDTFGGRERSDIEVERGDLLAILADAATAAGASVRFGARVVGVADDGDEPALILADGERVGADLVIAADGLRSAVRDLVVGEADVVRDLGYGIAVHRTDVDPGVDRAEMTYVAPGRTALVYDTGRHRRAMYLFERTATVPRDRADAAAYLRATYAGQGWVVPELLAGLEDAEPLYLDSVAQVVAPVWSRGRIVLLGDAAWCASPASGQGTSLALVGGYVLAAHVAASDLARGLADYEAALRPFVERNQALGPANIKRMVLGSPRAVRSTLSALRLIGRLPFGEWLMTKAMRPLHKAANAIDLDDAVPARREPVTPEI